MTQVSSAVMVTASLGAAYYMKLAYSSATPEIFPIVAALVRRLKMHECRSRDKQAQRPHAKLGPAHR